MRPARVAPGEPFACSPLCCGPNGLRNNLGGLFDPVESSKPPCQQGYRKILDPVRHLSKPGAITLLPGWLVGSGAPEFYFSGWRLVQYRYWHKADIREPPVNVWFRG